MVTDFYKIFVQQNRRPVLFIFICVANPQEKYVYIMLCFSVIGPTETSMMQELISSSNFHTYYIYNKLVKICMIFNGEINDLILCADCVKFFIKDIM